MLALLLVAANLRASVIAVSPVLDTIGSRRPVRDGSADRPPVALQLTAFMALQSLGF